MYITAPPVNNSILCMMYLYCTHGCVCQLVIKENGDGGGGGGGEC